MGEAAVALTAFKEGIDCPHYDVGAMLLGEFVLCVRSIHKALAGKR